MVYKENGRPVSTQPKKALVVTALSIRGQSINPNWGLPKSVTYHGIKGAGSPPGPSLPGGAGGNLRDVSMLNFKAPNN